MIFYLEFFGISVSSLFSPGQLTQSNTKVMNRNLCISASKSFQHGLVDKLILFLQSRTITKKSIYLPSSKKEIHTLENVAVVLEARHTGA